jgi:hypothetical protein
LKLPVIALVFGFMIIWSLEAQTDARLNGRWIGLVEGIEIDLRLNDGNYESLSNGISDSRGTYTANDGEFSMRPTHIFGGSVNSSIGFSLLETKWYTINEYITAIRAFFMEFGLSEEDTNEITDILTSPPSADYSVDANTLILTYTIEGDRVAVIYTKR